MSELRDLLQSSVAERMFGTGEQCWDLTSGLRFMAEYEPGLPIEQREALMADPRECGKIHVTDAAAINALLENGKIKILLYGVWSTFTLLKRDNNAGNVQVSFGVMQNSVKDQG